MKLLNYEYEIWKENYNGVVPGPAVYKGPEGDNTVQVPAEEYLRKASPVTSPPPSRTQSNDGSPTIFTTSGDVPAINDDLTLKDEPPSNTVVVEEGRGEVVEPVDYTEFFKETPKNFEEYLNTLYVEYLNTLRANTTHTNIKLKNLKDIRFKNEKNVTTYAEKTFRGAFAGIMNSGYSFGFNEEGITVFVKWYDHQVSRKFVTDANFNKAIAGALNKAKHDGTLSKSIFRPSFGTPEQLKAFLKSPETAGQIVKTSGK